MLTEEEFTELVDGVFPRVDLVGKSANGIPRFLIAKGAQPGLLEADTVRALVAKADDLTSKSWADLLTMVKEGSVAAANELDRRSRGKPPTPASLDRADSGPNRRSKASATLPVPPSVQTNSRVAKARSLDGQQAVFTANGRLLGAVDPKDIMKLATGEEKSESSPNTGEPMPTPPTDLVPAPSGTVGMVSKGVLRNAAERQVAAEAMTAGMAADRAVKAGTLSPAGALFAREQANRQAGQKVRQMRTRRRA